MSDIFRERGLPYDITIRARFGTTVCALVKAGLGIAVIDQFTVAHGAVSGVKLLRIEEPTRFDTFVVSKADTMLSSFAETFVAGLREEMGAVSRVRATAAPSAGRQTSPRVRRSGPT